MPKKMKSSEPKGPTRKELISECKSIIDRVPDDKLEEFIDTIRDICNDDPELKGCLDDVERIQLKDVASKRGIVIPEIDTLSLAKVKALLNSIENLDISGTVVGASVTSTHTAAAKASSKKKLGKSKPAQSNDDDEE